MATTLAQPFYLDMWASLKYDIGVIRLMGLWSAAIFTLSAAFGSPNLGLIVLWLFGWIRWVTILGFVWLASLDILNHVGASNESLAVVLAAEAIGVALGHSSPFVSHGATMTTAFTATQVAFIQAFHLPYRVRW